MQESKSWVHKRHLKNVCRLSQRLVTQALALKSYVSLFTCSSLYPQCLEEYTRGTLKKYICRMSLRLSPKL